MKPAIRIESLCKQYRLGARNQDAYQTLRESLTRAVRGSLRGLRRRSAGERRDTFWALKDVSFDVQPGEVVGVIGRNGAGKSTLLKILSRVVEPTAGRAEIRGRMGSLLEVGTGFHPELTGRENIYLNGSILGMSRKEIDRKFDEIVAFSEVEQFLDTPVKRYSSGMYVRLAFAVAAHLEPEILIVDEVLAVGDTAFQKKCLGRISDISQSGRTVIFVSHQMATVAALCRRAVWLEAGAVKAAGPSREVVDQYLVSSVKRLDSYLDLSIARRPDAAARSLSLEAFEWLTPLPVRHSEPLRARFHVRARSPVPGLALAVGFCSPEGTRLLTYDSDCRGVRYDVRSPGRYCVDLTIPFLPIAPGLYSLDLGARSGEGHTVDYLPGVIQLEIVPGEATPTCTMQHAGSGVRLDSDWDWHGGVQPTGRGACDG
jgi:lipopolysaccharide transport system ATP-binding protein